MSLTTDVLYGNRLYGQPTYSENNDPQSLSLPLSDSTTTSDSIVDSATQIISDAMGLTEILATSGIKVLSDSSSLTDLLRTLAGFNLLEIETLSDSTVIRVIKTLSDLFIVTDSLISVSALKMLSDSSTLSEQRLFQLHTTLAESLSILDNRIQISQTRSITDFIILNEWISIVLGKANIWATQGAQTNSSGKNVLYDVPEYSKDLYSADPTIQWQKAGEALTTWIPEEEPNVILPLYSQVLYGKVLYGQMPKVTWSNNTPEADENFTNFDGQGNVP